MKAADAPRRREQRFGSMQHLARRFFGALSPAGPSISDERWARAQLLPAECDLWERMSGPDRRHAVGVARETVELLSRASENPRREILAAALMHDVGKVEANLGALARTVVTIAAMLLGRVRPNVSSDRMAAGGWPPRARLYLTHDRVGGALLRDAGSDPLTIAWAEQHHCSPEQWTIDRQIGALLKSADDD
jgi:hypothetical protein